MSAMVAKGRQWLPRVSKVQGVKRGKKRGKTEHPMKTQYFTIFYFIDAEVKVGIFFIICLASSDALVFVVVK